jgi:hypothetical protein
LLGSAGQRQLRSRRSSLPVPVDSISKVLHKCNSRDGGDTLRLLRLSMLAKPHIFGRPTTVLPTGRNARPRSVGLEAPQKTGVGAAGTPPRARVLIFDLRHPHSARFRDLPVKGRKRICPRHTGDRRDAVSRGRDVAAPLWFMGLGAYGGGERDGCPRSRPDNVEVGAGFRAG